MGALFLKLRSSRPARASIGGRAAVVHLCVVLSIATAAVAQEGDTPRFVRPRVPEDLLGWRRSLPEQPPPLRGFRALLSQQDALPARWPFNVPGRSAPQPDREAARWVALHLARDGLPVTLTRTLDRLGPAAFREADDDALQRLRRVGLPVDWLAHFRLADQPDHGSAAFVRAVAHRLAGAANLDAVLSSLTDVSFGFQPSHPGFIAADEGTPAPIELLRLQLSSGDHAIGPGDGSGLDIAAQLAERLPLARLYLSISDQEEETFVENVKAWPAGCLQRLTVFVEPYPVTQWAQDNGRPGWMERDGQRPLATLVPRYANRGEEKSRFLPGETFLMESLASTGHVVVQSPLIFQGGNLMIIRRPPSNTHTTGERILLIGEAEIHRNTPLGLTRAQVCEAFAKELAVDRCVVMPAVSFHIDFEFSIRAHDGRLIALVNDSRAAVQTIINTGLRALADHGLIDATDVAGAEEALARHDDDGFFERIAGPIRRLAGDDGRYPDGVIGAFSSGPTDSGAANLQRFFVAMDMLAARSIAPDALPADPTIRDYLRAWHARDADRAALHDMLRDLDIDLVPVPSTACAYFSIDYLNGIHDASRYFMPAWGGLYAGLDAEAQDAIERAFDGKVTVVPIHSAESQRRLGALHCSVGVYPAFDRSEN